jgi:chromosome segregation ATPase
VPLVGFIIVAALLVAAVVLAIVFFLGKNSESDKKSDAQEQLASTRRERDRLQEQLGGAQSTGETLSDLLTQAASAADDMKSCTDAAGELQSATIDVLNARQAGEDVNPRIDGLNAQIDETSSVCGTSDQSYQSLIEALSEAQNE